MTADVDMSHVERLACPFPPSPRLPMLHRPPALQHHWQFRIVPKIEFGAGFDGRRASSLSTRCRTTRVGIFIVHIGFPLFCRLRVAHRRSKPAHVAYGTSASSRRQWEGFGSPRSSWVTGVAAAATVGHAERRRHRDREALHRQRGVRGRDYQQHRIRKSPVLPSLLMWIPQGTVHSMTYRQEITIAVQVMVDNLGYFAMALARVSR
ncbi:hypothetical protein GGX14DRAFT_566747 [Mycena pura]|uniref:Uncharacterized protein n=1 Tax=Mycena pura TaxID=153505 RepID=A0AAD6YE84_9AGAR|nr:hypothetical protein GGX14DRAFT_566747 [Mycena pura]